MDETQRLLEVLANLVPNEVLSLCDLLEVRARDASFMDRQVAAKLVEAVRAKCRDTRPEGNL